METSKVIYVCLFLSVTILLAHWNLILFCFSLKQRTFNAFPLTLDERYEIQQLILGRKVYSIFAWWSLSNIRSLFLFLWFQVISFYSGGASIVEIQSFKICFDYFVTVAPPGGFFTFMKMLPNVSFIIKVIKKKCFCPY